MSARVAAPRDVLRRPPRPPLWAGPGLQGRGRKGSVWRRTQQPRAPGPSAHSRKPRLSTGTVDRRPVCGRRRGLRIIPSGMATASPHRLLASTCCSQPAAATVFPVLWTRPWLHGGRETELCRHRELPPAAWSKSTPPPSSLSPGNHRSVFVRIILPFLEYLMNALIKSVNSEAGLFPLGTIDSHARCRRRQGLCSFFIAECYSMACVAQSL